MAEVNETPVYFPGVTADLFGVIAEPRGVPAETGVVLAYGAGHKMSAHRNRVWVRIARHLAAHGIASIRADRHGTGDAFGDPVPLDLDRPPTADVAAAGELLGQRGVGRLLYIGTCLGGRAALAAGAGDERTVGVSAAAIAVRPMPELNPQAASPVVELGVSGALRRDLETLAARGVPVQLLFGAPDATYRAFEGIASDEAGSFAGCDVDVLDAPLHGLPDLPGQRVYIDRVLAFARGSAGRSQ